MSFIPGSPRRINPTNSLRYERRTWRAGDTIKQRSYIVPVSPRGDHESGEAASDLNRYSRCPDTMKRILRQHNTNGRNMRYAWYNTSNRAGVDAEPTPAEILEDTSHLLMSTGYRETFVMV